MWKTISRLIIFLQIVLITSCEKGDEFPSLSNAECHGASMVGEWSIVENQERFYLDLDSTSSETYAREMILYEDGLGNLDFPTSSGDYFFIWTLQCSPDVFTMSTPLNNETDSLFVPFEFYTVSPFEIIVNDLNYKKLTRETYTEELNLRKIFIVEMTKKE